MTKIIMPYGTSGLSTITVEFRNSEGLILIALGTGSGTGTGTATQGEFEEYESATEAYYRVPMSEQDASGVYEATVPTIESLPIDLSYVVRNGETIIGSGSLSLDANGNEIAYARGNLLDAVLVESGITPSANLLNDTGDQLTEVNARQALAACLSALAGILSGAATTTITIKGVSVSISRIVGTVDADGNRSAVRVKVPD